MMKPMTKSVELEEGETLVLMDCKSAVNVAKIDTHFKPYTDYVVPTSGSKSGKTATTACGKQLNRRGTKHSTRYNKWTDTCKSMSRHRR